MQGARAGRVLCVGGFCFLSSFPPLPLPFSPPLPSWTPQKGLKQERDRVEMSTAAVLPYKYTPSEAWRSPGFISYCCCNRNHKLTCRKQIHPYSPEVRSLKSGLYSFCRFPKILRSFSKIHIPHKSVETHLTLHTKDQIYIYEPIVKPMK